MGLAVTAALVTSSANFVLPPSNILAGAVCVELDNNPAGASNLEALQVILSDQPMHYRSTFQANAKGPTVILFCLDHARPGTVKLAYFSSGATTSQTGWVIENVACPEPNPGLPNNYANPIFACSNGSGNRPMRGAMYWYALWDRWPGDDAAAAMMGQADGVMRSPLRFSREHLIACRVFHDAASPDFDLITGDPGMITGTFSAIADPARVEMLDLIGHSAEKDTYITSAVVEGNFGAALTTQFGANASCYRRTLLGFGNLIEQGKWNIPPGAMIVSATLRGHCRQPSGSAQPFSAYGLAEDFTEGGCTDGSVADGVTCNTQPGLLSDSRTPGFAQPVMIGAASYEIAATVQALLASGGLCGIELKRDAESAPLGFCSFDSLEADPDAWRLEIVYDPP